jgi:hypothetical protein
MFFFLCVLCYPMSPLATLFFIVVVCIFSWFHYYCLPAFFSSYFPCMSVLLVIFVSSLKRAFHRGFIQCRSFPFSLGEFSLHSVAPTLNGLQLAGCLYWFIGVGLFCADGSHVSCTVMGCLFCLEMGRSIWAGFGACFSLHSHGQRPFTAFWKYFKKKLKYFYLFLFILFIAFLLHVCECPVKCY